MPHTISPSPYAHSMWQKTISFGVFTLGQSCLVIRYIHRFMQEGCFWIKFLLFFLNFLNGICNSSLMFLALSTRCLVLIQCGRVYIFWAYTVLCRKNTFFNKVLVFFSNFLKKYLIKFQCALHYLPVALCSFNEAENNLFKSLYDGPIMPCRKMHIPFYVGTCLLIKILVVFLFNISLSSS